MHDLFSYTPQRESYQKMQPHITRLQQVVLDALGDWPAGLTASELVQVTGLDYATIQPRPGELFKRGLVVKDGTRRNAKGNRETVWKQLTRRG